MTKSTCIKFILPGLVYLALLVLLISLGFWQLDRAQQKQDLMEQQEAMLHESPLELTASVNSLESLKFHPVIVKGTYDDSHQFLLDNQVNNGTNGYFVMTPLLIDEGKNAILINRGWVPGSLKRSEKPDVSIKNQKVKITGIIKNFPGVGFKLDGAEIPAPGWPAVVQLIDSEFLSDRLGYSLKPFQVLLDPSEDEGYIRDWKINYRITPEKHEAYAFQWFSLAVALTLLFGWLLIHRKKIS